MEEKKKQVTVLSRLGRGCESGRRHPNTNAQPGIHCLIPIYHDMSSVRGGFILAMCKH